MNVNNTLINYIAHRGPSQALNSADKDFKDIPLSEWKALKETVLYLSREEIIKYKLNGSDRTAIRLIREAAQISKDRQNEAV